MSVLLNKVFCGLIVGCAALWSPFSRDPAYAESNQRAQEDSGAAKAPFKLKDIYRVQWPSGPRISPDGKQITFAVTQYDLAAASANTDIWVMDADGGNLRRLTDWKGYDGAPNWSPDGRSLVFVSGRSGSSDLWSLPLEGGDPTQLTSISTGIDGYVGSPDGRYIAFDSTVYPECGADEACNRTREALRTRGPLQAHVADDLLYRHWDDWADGRRSQIFLLDLKSLEVRALTDGAFDAPAFHLNGGDGYAFSPDSKELCFVSNHDSDPATSTNVDLFVVPVEGGAAKNLTVANKGWDAMPQYSPDGRYIAYLTQKTAGYESELISIALYDRQAGTSRVVSASFDNWVLQFAWADRGRALMFTAEVEARTPLYRLDFKKGTTTRLHKHGLISGFELAPEGTWGVMVRRTVNEPSEIYRFDMRRGGCEASRLTSFNKALEQEVDLRPAEEMWVEGADGARIQVFVIKPHGFEEGRKYPLILNVHGGPQSQWYDAYRSDWQLYPGAGYVVAFCNPHGSTGYGQAFTAEISGDWGGQTYQDLMKVTDALETLPYVDRDRMGAMGWSFGGYMMNWIQGQTDRFKALASMMGIYDLRSFYGSTEELWWPEWDLKGTPWSSELYEKWSPSNYVRNFKTPMLVISGETDYRIPYTQSMQMFTALRKMNVPARLIVLEDNGHWPEPLRAMALYYNAHLEWFHTYLGGDPAPWDSHDFAQNRVFEEDKARVGEDTP